PPPSIYVTFRPTAGATLDYASILDAGHEFTLTVNGADVPVNGTPTPMLLKVDPATGASSYQTVSLTYDWNGDGVIDNKDMDVDGDGSVDQTKDLIALLVREGVTVFRYDLTNAAYKFAPGDVSVAFLPYNSLTGEGFQDLAGNPGGTSTQAFT